MSTLAQCEALAADPARLIFKGHLLQLKAAPDYDRQFNEAIRIGGYLSGLLECDAITCTTHRALLQEIQAFVWGPRP
ncbi:MAG: hypothetical protein VR76_07650 [Pseudomonas sp. BRH_c35]|nr:MAG: hypothetical protein VR76_07650 [Pseudomonas sp. BRH_c35]